ncbi:hypothetical protein VTH06DRAFT_7784 [Thermothelomyces fergusii]
MGGQTDRHGGVAPLRCIFSFISSFLRALLSSRCQLFPYSRKSELAAMAAAKWLSAQAGKSWPVSCPKKSNSQQHRCKARHAAAPEQEGEDGTTYDGFDPLCQGTDRVIDKAYGWKNWRCGFQRFFREILAGTVQRVNLWLPTAQTRC